MKKQLQKWALSLFVLQVLSLLPLCLSAQFTQQGNKLVGTGNTGAARQGSTVALSGDGNTILVGGPGDNSIQGAVWVFTRSGGTWTQQGSKLVGTGNTGAANQGGSVALSADGNTALIGGWYDNSQQGAAWVFTRSGGTWTQQGSKLVGTGNTGTAYQSYSVALSADGNTALVSGWNDNSEQGAVWVFVRSGSTWTQQGNKLVGTGNVGAARQGVSVALSADGNTALIGGEYDNSQQGAVWVFTRSGGIWTQQGSKLVGTGNTGAARQGSNVALSGDGNTAIICGVGDNSYVGAAWVFTRSGGTWTQQGSKLVGTGNVGTPFQGTAAVSYDGNVALLAGGGDNSGVGAVWVFTRSGGTWTQQGNKLVGANIVGSGNHGCSVGLSSDGGTALAGAYRDNGDQGAAWVYTQAVLPIEMINFTGQNTEKGNLLTWETANEVNNKGFSVERSPQPPKGALTTWETLGFVAAKGKAAMYEFADKAPFGGGGLYRLRQIDNDGKETLSKVVSISRSNSTKLKTYPNPVSNVLTVENTVTSERDGAQGDKGGNYQILNLLGQQVLGGKVSKSVDVSALPKGSYVLKVDSEQVKFIKQ